MVQLKTMCVAVGVAALLAVTAPGAQAYCGFFEATATATYHKNALARAERQVKRQINALRRQVGKKLVIDKQTWRCVGGEGGVDPRGKPVKGYNRCTFTQGYCVNP